MDSIFDPSKCFISLDNSRHDAHQDTKIHAANVTRVFSELERSIREKLDLCQINVDNLRNYFTSGVHKIGVRYAGMSNRIKIAVRGTTISGNAALTTLGNSLNVWSALSVIIENFSARKDIPYDPLRLGPENTINFILAGDDSLIHMPDNLTDEFQEYLFKYVYGSRDEEIDHGIGWCCTEIHKHDCVTAGFLSKIFFHTDIGFDSLRKIQDLVAKSNNYTGSNTILVKDPESYQALVSMSQRKELKNTYLECIADHRERLSRGFFNPKVLDPLAFYEMHSIYKEKDTNKLARDLTYYDLAMTDIHQLFIDYIKPQLERNHRSVVAIPKMGFTIKGTADLD